MLVLGIETTGMVASAAIAGPKGLVAETTLNLKRNHSVTLMPMIEGLFKLLDMRLSEMDYIACSAGPGSFTGLRIGAATAKALAHSIGKPVIPVPSLDALAYNVFNHERLIVPLMDAKRNQVYSSVYRWEGSTLVRLEDYMAEELGTVINKASRYGKELIFLGDGAAAYQEQLKGLGMFAPDNVFLQRAASVACLGLLLQDKGQDYKAFAPFYLRKPQAEREREERGR